MDSLRCIHESTISFVQINDGIYKFFKNRLDNRRGYVTENYIVDTLNRVDKVSICNRDLEVIHANFNMGDDANEA